jgi:hypothetical protein
MLHQTGQRGALAWGAFQLAPFARDHHSAPTPDPSAADK